MEVEAEQYRTVTGAGYNPEGLSQEAEGGFDNVLGSLEMLNREIPGPTKSGWGLGS